MAPEIVVNVTMLFSDDGTIPCSVADKFGIVFEPSNPHQGSVHAAATVVSLMLAVKSFIRSLNVMVSNAFSASI